MSVQHPHEIKEYLQRPDVQERIQQSIQQARSNVTVTISKAASLFGFTESRLREWEKKDLLTTDRSNLDGKEGHRRYSTNELDKLAILQELIKKGGYSLSQIPTDLDAIWQHIEPAQQNHIPAQPDLAIPTESIVADSTSKKHIDQRVEHAEQEIFWRYFTAQALRLSLMLICEDIPDTMAGLILPIGTDARFIGEPIDLPKLNEAVIGWLNPNGSFDTFLDTHPSFEHPSDFRIEPLHAVGEEEFPADKTMIVIQRKVKPLSLSLALVQTIRRLLNQVYNNSSDWYPAYNYGLRDYLYQATDFSSSAANLSDDVLDKLMNMVVQIGGKSTQHPGQDRWWFCCLLLSQDASSPLQKRSLVVRAQSKHSPYKVNISSVTIDNPGLSLRAYQSGNIIYRPDMSAKDLIIAYGDQEQSSRSAIAIPIADENGLSIATLYIASREDQSFPKEDQRILRLIGTMIEELLLTYLARQQVSGKRTDLIDQPEIVDPSFKSFHTENDFIRDLEILLSRFQETNLSEQAPEEALSFIVIDIDDQSTLSVRYGDRVARNLSKEVGIRLSGHLKLFDKLAKKRLYHVNADRYYLIVDGMSLDETRQNAEQIRVALKGKYLIDAQRLSNKRSELPTTMLELHDVTIRAGVTSYKYKKVQEVLGRYDTKTAVAEFRALIMGSLVEVLDAGRREGGNNIMSWDEKDRGYRIWIPPSSEIDGS